MTSSSSSSVRSGKFFTKVVWLGAAAMFVCAVGQNVTVVSYAQGAATVWDGIYTSAQSARGKTLYADQCAVCHGKDLEGTTLAPGLSGTEFMADFEGSNMGQLFSRILRTMPASAPGDLMPSQVADLLAFMAESNKWPAGEKDLATDQDALKLIKVVKK